MAKPTYEEMRQKRLEENKKRMEDLNLTQLVQTLKKMKKVDLRPNPNALPKRGRGRPSKPKVPFPPGHVLSPPRPRGRPPKPKVPFPPAHVPSQPRPRGPSPKPKVPLPPVHVPSLPGQEGVRRSLRFLPRPRGHPPKPKDFNAIASPKVSSGRPRGRPSKMAGSVGAPMTTGPPRPRGRPRGKVKTQFAPVGFDQGFVWLL